RPVEPHVDRPAAAAASPPPRPSAPGAPEWTAGELWGEFLSGPAPAPEPGSSRMRIETAPPQVAYTPPPPRMPEPVVPPSRSAAAPQPIVDEPAAPGE